MVETTEQRAQQTKVTLSTNATKGDRLRSLQLFLFGNGRVFGRKPISWLLSLLYLIALWSFIGLLCSLLMMCLFFICERQPLFYGRGSFIGGIPGISYEPLDRSSSASRVIKWSAGTTIYSQILHEHLKKYLHDGASRYVDCRNSSQMINSCASCECMSKTAPCDVNVSDNDDKYGLGECAFTENATFGFNEGAPCILLRVNKIIGYYPMRTTEDGGENRTESSENIGRRLCCNEENFRFECSIKEHTNLSISYFPSAGFPYCFFPYCQQKQYKQPFIMVKLSSLPLNQEVKLQCSPTPPDLKGIRITIPLLFTD